MNPPTASTSSELGSCEKPWRTTTLKNAILKKLEEAIMCCSVALADNAADIENRIYLQTDTKADYKREVERTVDEIYNMSISSLVEQRRTEEAAPGEERPGPSREAYEHPKQQKSTWPNRKIRKLQRRQARIKKARLLKQRAINYLSSAKPCVDPIELMPLVAKKKRRIALFSLQKYLCNLLEADGARQRQELVAADAETGEIAELEQVLNEWKAKLASFFAAIEQQEQLPVVPTYLCDPISLALFKDPVVVPPAGNSYEREVILDYINRKGRYDPITKIRLPSDAVIPNDVIQSAVEAFIQENEWAQTD